MSFIITMVLITPFFNGFLMLGLTDIKGKVLKGKMILFDLETSDLD